MTRYLLVGVTERMDEFVELLEVILPRLFKGITEKLRKGVFYLFFVGKKINYVQLRWRPEDASPGYVVS